MHLALVVPAKHGPDERVGLRGRQGPLGPRPCAIAHGAQQAVQVLVRVCMVAQPVPALAGTLSGLQLSGLCEAALEMWRRVSVTMT